MYAHVGGIPVEETTLALAPIAALMLGALVRAGDRLARLARSHRFALSRDGER
jgi:hypothetical protein